MERRRHAGPQPRRPSQTGHSLKRSSSSRPNKHHQTAPLWRDFCRKGFAFTPNQKPVVIREGAAQTRTKNRFLSSNQGAIKHTLIYAYKSPMSPFLSCCRVRRGRFCDEYLKHFTTRHISTFHFLLTVFGEVCNHRKVEIPEQLAHKRGLHQ